MNVQPIATSARLGYVTYESPQPNILPAYGGNDHDVPETGQALGKYTQFAGAWLSADGQSFTHAFTELTGPTSPYGQSRSTQGRSYAQATVSSVYRKSTDGGATFTQTKDCEYIGEPYGFTQQPTIALRAHPSNGNQADTLLRRINGEDLNTPGSYAGPRTAFLQRRAPGASGWSDLPTPYGGGIVLDPSRYTYQFSRILRLNDGRLVATGNFWRAAAGTRNSGVPNEWLLMVSSDEGATWRNALTVPADAPPANEWDIAEIPGGGGDLLAVMRTGGQIRMQVRLTKGAAGRSTNTGTSNDSDGWVMQSAQSAPFPHSGHPELLAARVGSDTSPSVILHLATTGAHYTSDGGATWNPLPFDGGLGYATNYYPHAVQTADNVIHVFSHRGGDYPYRPDVAEAVIYDRFSLRHGTSFSAFGLGETSLEDPPPTDPPPPPPPPPPPDPPGPSSAPVPPCTTPPSP